jgi:hypothetical protein
MSLQNSKNKNMRDKLINSVWIKEELPCHWKEPIVLPIYKKGNKTDCAIIVGCHC